MRKYILKLAVNFISLLAFGVAFGYASFWLYGNLWLSLFVGVACFLGASKVLYKGNANKQRKEQIAIFKDEGVSTIDSNSYNNLQVEDKIELGYLDGIRIPLYIKYNADAIFIMFICHVKEAFVIPYSQLSRVRVVDSDEGEFIQLELEGIRSVLHIPVNIKLLEKIKKYRSVTC